MFEKSASVLVLLIVSVGVAAADEFGVVITKVDGENVTFYKTPTNPGEKQPKREVFTLAAKDAKVFEGKFQFNKEKMTVQVVPGDAIEGGLKNEVFKLVGKESIVARITTSDDNKSITRILSLKPGKKKPVD